MDETDHWCKGGQRFQQDMKLCMEGTSPEVGSGELVCSAIALSDLLPATRHEIRLIENGLNILETLEHYVKGQHLIECGTFNREANDFA